MTGGSKTTSVTNVPPPSEAELAMQGKQLDLAALQIGAIKDQTLMQWQQFNAAGPVLEQQAQLLQKQLELLNSPEQADYQRQSIELQRQQLAYQQQQLANLNSPEAKQYQDQALALQRSGLSAQEAQLELMRQQIGQYNTPEAAAQRAKEAQLTGIQLDQAIRLAPMQEELANLQLAQIKQGTRATDEQKRLIAAATDAAIGAGTSDITKSSLDALRLIRDEYAPSVGLRPTDTPVLDRAGRVAEEATRQVGQLTTNLRGAQAQAELNYPLAQQQVMAGITSGQQNLLAATQNFQSQLSQAAQQNRMALYGGAGNFALNSANLGTNLITSGLAGRDTGLGNALPWAQNFTGAAMGGGLGLATGIPGGSSLTSGLSGLQRDRFASASTTQTTNPSIFGMLQQGIGAVGGLASGIGAITSSRLLKNRVADVDAEALLERFANLAVERWRYRGEGVEHIGPYAEDFRDAFGVGDGVTIDVVDALGVLFAAVKALAARAPANA